MTIHQGIVLRHFANSAHIYRQISATLAASMLSLCGGLTFGFSAVLLPQLENDKNFPYDRNLDSWIASISPLAMIMGCLFSGSMSDGIGRKSGQLVLIVPFTVGWILIGLSTNNTMMLIGRFIIGVITGATNSNTMVYVGEISDPKYRSMALFCLSVAFRMGTLISHTIGKYVYWQTSCFIFVIPNVITLIILLFLKESPLWLLSKGKIDEGIESFRLFRGTGESAEKELSAALEKCKANTKESSFKENFKIIISKPFIKSLLTILMLFITTQWCGINTISFYAQEIFQKTFSGDVDAYLLMLATDCIRISASAVVCLFAKKLPRKITFVSFCFGIALILAVLIIYLYISPVGFVWIAVVCLVIYSVLASSITCISWSFVAEIFPAEVRGFGSGLSSAIAFVLLFISVKITPQIMANYGELVMYGQFAFFSFIGGLILIFILPETSGKSLQDIEDTLYKNNKNIGEVKSNVDVVTVPSNQGLQIVAKL